MKTKHDVPIEIIFQTNQEVAYTLSQRIKQERIAQNISQKEIAHKTQIPLPSYQRFEHKGEITLERLVSIIRALNQASLLETLFDFAQPRAEMRIEVLLEREAKKSRKRASKKYTTSLHNI